MFIISDYSDSAEVKFEELKNVKLEEEDEEEEQEAAALDLSVNPASITGRLVFSGSKKKSSSSLGSSSRDSVSSDSETSEPLSCQAEGQTGVLTVHSYARGDGRVTVAQPCTRKKGSAPRSISERELAEVQSLGTRVEAAAQRHLVQGRWACGKELLQLSRKPERPLSSVPPATLVVSDRKPDDMHCLTACSLPAVGPKDCITGVSVTAVDSHSPVTDVLTLKICVFLVFPIVLVF